MQAVERHLKILIESLGLRISKTFVQAIGHYTEISIDVFLAENISIYHGRVYIVQAI